MNASEYRAEYALFSRDLERERERAFVAGSDDSTPELKRVADRYGDLHTHAAIDELIKLYDATPAEFADERAGLRRLAHRAQARYASARAQNSDEELHDALARREIRFEGAAIPLVDVPARLAHEGRAAARSEIAARWLDELPACDRVREARLADLDSAAVELGFDSFSALRRDADHETTSAWEDSARSYLSLTDEVYRRSLPRRITRFAPGTDPYRPTYADSLFFERLPHADALFPTGALAAAYRNTLAALRLPEDKVAFNVRDLPERFASARYAAAFAVDPPTRVRVEARSVAGFDAHRSLLLAAGRAQHLAWSSMELRAPPGVCMPGGRRRRARSRDRRSDETRTCGVFRRASVRCAVARGDLRIADRRSADARTRRRVCGNLPLPPRRRTLARACRLQIR